MGFAETQINGKKMSFDVNVLSTKPVIKAAASMNNDGGGGNLGYMAQGRKKEKDRKYLDESIFLKNQSDDIFGLDKEPELPEDSLFAIIARIIKNIKNILRIK